VSDHHSPGDRRALAIHNATAQPSKR
jgi:hypothetical protein